LHPKDYYKNFNEGVGMTFNFDLLPDRETTECAKWGKVDKGVLPMWVADMDFVSPEPVIKALIERINHGVFGYALHPDGLYDEIINWVLKRHGWEISHEDIILVPGVVAGFNLAAHAVTLPGDGVVIQTPAYGPFFGVAKNADLTQQEMALSIGNDGKYVVDLDQFEACLTGRSRIFMLCNPHNPSGRVFLKHELEKMAEICLSNNMIICSDEIHSDLVFKGNKHIPIASLSPEIADKTITLFAPSKTFNIAGLKTSVAVITNENLRSKFQAARKGLLGDVNLLGQYAMLAAYKDGEAWLEALLVYLEANRDFLFEFVNEHLQGIHMIKPEGTFLGWLDCRGVNVDTNPSDYFKTTAKTYMNEGDWFGEIWKDFVRINFGCPRHMLADCLMRMKESLEKQ
jgi:cystathionine beta-lyase